MSRMSTSLASFSWARSAIRRACSRDFRSVCAPRWLEIRVSPVEAGDFDFPRDGLRNQARDRLRCDDAASDLARGDVERRDLEELDAVRLLELGEDVLERLARVSGPRRDAEPRAAQDLIRLLPRRKRGELVGPDEKDGVGKAVLA